MLHPECMSQTACRSVEPFLHTSRWTGPIAYNGPPGPLYIKNCYFATGTPSNSLHGSTCRPESKTQTPCRSFQLFFAGLMIVTDRPTNRQTDHTTRSVTIRRIYASSTAMRSNNVSLKSPFRFTHSKHPTLKGRAAYQLHKHNILEHYYYQLCHSRLLYSRSFSELLSVYPGPTYNIFPGVIEQVLFTCQIPFPTNSVKALKKTNGKLTPTTAPLDV